MKKKILVPIVLPKYIWIMVHKQTGEILIDTISLTRAGCIFEGGCLEACAWTPVKCTIIEGN